MPSAATFHVSPAGHDRNPGTRARPFATLERARHALREIGSLKPRRVIVHEGVYRLAASFELGPEDSGTPDRPVVWEAAAGETVRLVGGRDLPAPLWQPVTDPETRSALPAGVRDQVREVDLRALGIETPLYPSAFHGAPPGPELFVNDVRMPLARWPNEGWATIANFLEAGSNPSIGEKDNRPGAFEYREDNPSTWNAARGVWLLGFWCYDWSEEVLKVRSIDPEKKRIDFEAPHQYSVMKGNPSPRRYIALNVLEELDRPGEWVMDAARGKIYLLAPAPYETACITLSELTAPLVKLHHASCVTWRGFTVECGQAHGLEIDGGAACRVDRCEVRNMRQQAIRVKGGFGHCVSHCDIHHTGTGGVELIGGDRKTLQPGGHTVEFSHIRRVSEHLLTYASAITLSGVGNRAAHNRLHDARHQAVSIVGNDHLFEYNEVYDVCLESDDCGALYKGRNPSCRGNVIRFNYWHDIGSTMGHGSSGVYFDDGDSDDVVFGNLFVRVGDPGWGASGALLSHGGHDNRVDNNIFVDCKQALGALAWTDKAWRDAIVSKDGQPTLFMKKMVTEIDVTREPYVTRYPRLKGFMDPQPGAVRNNYAAKNVFVRCPSVWAGNWVVDGHSSWITDEDPGFVDAAHGDFRLRKDAPLYKQIKGFKPIPFESIGLPR